MRILEFCRNQAYWLIDIMRGGYVKKYYDDLQKYCSPIVSRKDVAEYHRKAISELLIRIQKNVPYYSNMSEIELSSWPVINKATIKDNKVDFLSKEYKETDLFKMSTSGSTGTPFVSLQNIEKKRHVNAETLYYLGLQGYHVGQRIIFLRAVVEECQKSKWKQFCQNIYQINCSDLSDKGISEKLLEIAKLSKRGGAVLIAYASTFEALHQYFERNGYEEAEKCKINSITSGSEMLYDATRESMEKAFKCKCFSRYANEENGFLGQDGVENNAFFIDNAGYYIEILKFVSDEPASVGEQGRIVVTDLFNYAQPMIRYDTGDVGAFVEVMDGFNKRTAIGNFGGRVVDSIYGTERNLISPHAITNAMWRYQSIKQFQFIQKGQKEYLIKVNKGNSDIDEVELQKSICNVVGTDANVKVEYCDDIPVLASGKRRYIVNEMRI
ncbi:hypothetical protein [Blautia sp.]|jgi:phenylacetate-CoA ligase|uniref:hypothetical protein n=1 Tax=Blautia sp. TaxID=1955243 RepID=UPI003D92EFD7